MIFNKMKNLLSLSLLLQFMKRIYVTLLISNMNPLMIIENILNILKNLLNVQKNMKRLMISKNHCQLSHQFWCLWKICLILNLSMNLLKWLINSIQGWIEFKPIWYKMKLLLKWIFFFLFQVKSQIKNGQWIHVIS